MHKDNENHLSLNQKQLSFIVASLLLGSFFVFMAGYYWGKRHVLEPVTERVAQDAFADKIYCSLCAQDAEVVSKDKVEGMPGQEKDSGGYYAQLAGFGSKKMAQDCVAKLQLLGLKSKVLERFSSSDKTKVAWYQVATDVYTSKNELLNALKVFESKGAQKIIKLQRVTLAYVNKEQKDTIFGRERQTA